MISVIEAKDIVRNSTRRLPIFSQGLDQAMNHVLADDVHAPSDIPGFDQSSVDGYAFRIEDWINHKTLVVGTELPAGHNQVRVLGHREANRIFTGAALPMGADTVIMQEKAIVENGELNLLDPGIQKGNAVRQKGSEIAAGELALPKDSLLSPAAIGFLAGMGLKEVPVFARPRVSIIVTGAELLEPGQSPIFGQVFESNSYILRAALGQLHIDVIQSIRVADEIGSLQSALEDALAKSDMVLTTGGASVGDYDFLAKAASGCGIIPLFHFVRQRPGKPLYLGKRENRMVFGLPGNPGSVLTCFYEYVIPALEEMTGQKKIIGTRWLPLAKPWQKNAGLTHFLKARYDDGQVTPLDAQDSYRLHSFARANCLVCLEEEASSYSKGDLVEVHILPV
jgi:molybdopterin molybdotransferase